MRNYELLAQESYRGIRGERVKKREQQKSLVFRRSLLFSEREIFYLILFILKFWLPFIIIIVYTSNYIGIESVFLLFSPCILTINLFVRHRWLRIILFGIALGIFIFFLVWIFRFPKSYNIDDIKYRNCSCSASSAGLNVNLIEEPWISCLIWPTDIPPTESPGFIKKDLFPKGLCPFTTGVCSLYVPKEEYYNLSCPYPGIIYNFKRNNSDVLCTAMITLMIILIGTFLLLDPFLEYKLNRPRGYQIII